MITGIWEEFLKIIKDEAGSRVVETWFKAVTLIQCDTNQRTVYLQAPNVFVKDWIQANYIVLLQMHLGRLFNIQAPKIVFVDGSEKVEQVISPPKQSEALFIPATVIKPNAVVCTNAAMDKVGFINKNYSFTTFVVGPHNSLAHAAAHAIAEKPGQLYNPLFIYGGSGLGKTHLLHSIGNEIKCRNKKMSVLYQPTDRFVNEFISAIRFDRVHKFREKYKDVDVLLIDDVQFISNKEQTQEAFFHIFNSLYDAHKQIVFSGDTFPQDIKGLAERLRSRLSCGLIADIQPPSLETKIAILKKKAESIEAVVLDDEVANFIAVYVDSNVRELEGALIRVMAFASLTKQPLNLELAKKVLVRTALEKQSSNVNSIDFGSVIKCVNKYYACDLASLQSKSRNKELSFARQVAMFLMKKVSNKSLRSIGDFLGGRDHSTVLHAINKVESEAVNNKEFQIRLQRMEEEIVGL